MTNVAPLSCRDVIVGFGERVLSSCPSLIVENGVVVGVTGPNGSGKTTLLNIVSGWQRPLGGAVSVCGVDIIGREPSGIARLGLRRSFQGGRVLEDRSLVEQMALSRAGQTVLDVASLARSTEFSHWTALARASLAQGSQASLVAERPLQALSGGLQRYADTIACLYGTTRLCVLDEPFAGLSEALRNDVQSAIARTAASGTGVLIVDHDRRRLSEIAAVVYEFRIVSNGTMVLEQAT